MIPTPFNTMTLQRRDCTSSITSGSLLYQDYTTSRLTTLPSASTSSSPSATVIGLSTGDGPITPVTNTAVDLTLQELANTDGTTEDVEDLQSRLAIEKNQYS